MSTSHPPRESNDAPITPSAPPGRAKLQRWIDLVAGLLARSAPVTFDELARDVPEYLSRIVEAESAASEGERRRILASLKRTFERDKEELRLAGVALESHPDGEGNSGGKYRLRRRDFYLPYLCLAVPGGDVAVPRRVEAWGYQALSALTFDADELQAVVDAAAAVRRLGDSLLVADVSSAMRKLAVDLPVDAVAERGDEPRVLLPRVRADASIFAALSDALVRRKRARFTYRAMSTGISEEREVEPYGLFFLNGHWYLAGQDRMRAALRNFRLNRVAAVNVNAARAHSPDYEIPPDFRLRDHARARHPWELGDGDAAPAVAEFRGEAGPTVAAMKLGRPVDGHDRRRAFDVRRPDAFVRWVVSFAGEVLPIAPDAIVRAYAAEVTTTRALYAMAPSEVERAGGRGGTTAPPAPSRQRAGGRSSEPSASDAGRSRPWEAKGAAAQLRRVLHVVPLIADGEEHDLEQVAARVGTSVEILRGDLYSLVDRFDVPGGFVEGVQLFLEAQRVSARSSHFQRPMRLTVSELCALELGLSVLRVHRPPDEHAVLDRARERLRAVIAELPDDPIPDGLYGAAAGENGSTAHLAAVRTALREHRRLQLTYRKSGSTTSGVRLVCPYGLVAANGMLYVVAHCIDEKGVRVFRLDRVEDAVVLEEEFERPEDFSLESVLQDGRVFHHPEPEVMRVRYSPRVARWIAEREGRKVKTDGSLVIDHPLVDREWGMRHVLQYGAEAEVLEPEALREALRERLTGMLRQPDAEGRE